MSLTAGSTAEARLIDLHEVLGRGDFFTRLAEILERDLDVRGFAVEIYDRGGNAFIEHTADGGPGAQPAAWPLTVGGEDFGRLLLPAGAAGRGGEVVALCRHLAPALYHLMLAEEQERLLAINQEQIQALQAMSEVLGELDLDPLLNRLLKFFVDLLQVDVGASRFLADGEVRYEARWGMPRGVLRRLVAAPAREPEDADRPHRLVALDPPGNVGRFRLGAVLRADIALDGGRAVDLYLVTGEERTWDPHQRSLLRSCLPLAAAALQRALDHEESIRRHRLSEQLEVARRIQEQLLPARLPSRPDMDIVGRSLPAQYVGGDYYDVLVLPDGALLAFVADVSGKGVQAAMRMSALRAVLHSLDAEILAPACVLSRLNRQLTADGMAGRFVTAACLRLNLDGGLRLALAGHEPPLRVDASGAVAPLDAEPGLPLGLRDGTDYAETAGRLAPGERLLVYTDGLPDTRDPGGRQYGEERLRRRLAEASGAGAAALLDTILSDLERFRAGAPWADDHTLLVFHRHEGES
ncbi:MAG: serine/threonine-protein phosphatase [Candidatus Krumholzibacteriota bacterium]|nr:serine/threonine-protein phosphatase [Candidatus Krumholzibacteriota bacterium]